MRGHCGHEAPPALWLLPWGPRTPSPLTARGFPPLGARSTPCPLVFKGAPHPECAGGQVRRCRSLWSLNPGVWRRESPPAVSPPLPVAFQPTHSALLSISQLHAVAPSPLAPSRGLHLPAGTCPAGPPGRGFGRAIVLEVMGLPHETAARTCLSLLPEPGSEGGARWGFGSHLCLLFPTTSQRPSYCASGSLSVLRALCNWHTRPSGFPH